MIIRWPVFSEEENLDEYYRIPPDLRDLNYGKYIDQGERDISDMEEYNSHNTTRLDVGETMKLLMKLCFVKALVNGEFIEPEEQ